MTKDFIDLGTNAFVNRNFGFSTNETAANFAGNGAVSFTGIEHGWSVGTNGIFSIQQLLITNSPQPGPVINVLGPVSFDGGSFYSDGDGSIFANDFNGGFTGDGSGITALGTNSMTATVDLIHAATNNLNATRLTSGTVPLAALGNAQATNATLTQWQSIATNAISPSQIISNGTYIPSGTLATNSGSANSGFLQETGTNRRYTTDGGNLTGLNGANITGTIAAAQLVNSQATNANLTAWQAHSTNDYVGSSSPTFTGTPIFAAGASNAVSLGITSTTNGFYGMGGGNSIGVSIGGTNVVTLTNSTVGINAVAPLSSRVLDVYGDQQGTNLFFVSKTNSLFRGNLGVGGALTLSMSGISATATGEIDAQQLLATGGNSQFSFGSSTSSSNPGMFTCNNTNINFRPSTGAFIVGILGTSTASGQIGVLSSNSFQFVNKGTSTVGGGFGIATNDVPTVAVASGKNLSLVPGAGNVGINQTNAAFPLDTTGVVAATGGFHSTKSNLSGPTTISVGASPFSWTNTVADNLFVFVAGGTASEIDINGTALGLGLSLTGLETIPLQTNEIVTITYTIAPTMKWKPE